MCGDRHCREGEGSMADMIWTSKEPFTNVIGTEEKWDRKT